MKKNNVYLREDVLRTLSLRQLQLLTSKPISRRKRRKKRKCKLMRKSG